MPPKHRRSGFMIRSEILNKKNKAQKTEDTRVSQDRVRILKRRQNLSTDTTGKEIMLNMVGE